MKIQLIEKEVNQANQLVRVSEDLDREYDHLTGIAFLDTIGISHILKSSSIGGKELFPKNFEVTFLQSSLLVAPNDRFFTLSPIIAQGEKLELDFQDSGSGRNYPYTLKIYLRLENEK